MLLRCTINQPQAKHTCFDYMAKCVPTLKLLLLSAFVRDGVTRTNKVPWCHRCTTAHRHDMREKQMRHTRFPRNHVVWRRAARKYKCRNTRLREDLVVPLHSKSTATHETSIHPPRLCSPAPHQHSTHARIVPAQAVPSFLRHPCS